MPYVKPLSDKQSAMISELREGLKANGFTFGQDAKARVEEYRRFNNRIKFVPCNAEGWPTSDVPGANPLITGYKQLTQGVSLSPRGLVTGAQNMLFGRATGGRSVIELYANPTNFNVAYKRNDPSNQPKGSQSDSPSEKSAQEVMEADSKGDSITGMRGRTHANWGAPDATITMDGYCGGAPEIQIPRLKAIYGMFDPSISNRAGVTIQGNQTLRESIRNEYPKDPALYLWELLYYPVTWPSGSKIPWQKLKGPQRYFGWCDTLEFTHEVGETGDKSQWDVHWKMTFKVLQRRDYDYVGP